MALEAATYISGLNANNPVGASDPKSQGDDHLRLIKSTVLNSFPNITGPVLSSQTELNLLDGVTGVTGTGNLVLSNSPTFSGPATGSGAGLTNLNASELTTGTVPGARFPATLPAVSGADLTSLNATQLTSGTIPAARIAASGVTQHQAALSIAETQIADGAVFPRLAAAEAVTGAWTFSATPIKASKGAFPYFESSTNSGGAISVSTADASGTPAAGDLWFKYTP